LRSSCSPDAPRTGFKPSQALPGTNVRNPPPELNLSEVQILEHAAAQPPSPVAGEGWRPLFDGHSLTGWRIIDYGGQSRVAVRKKFAAPPVGAPFTGVNFTNDAPESELRDFPRSHARERFGLFLRLTFPVRDSFCSLIVGGWGGTLVGLSSLDGADASENETTQFVSFETGRWYRIRLRVTENKIEAWIEQKKVRERHHDRSQSFASVRRHPNFPSRSASLLGTRARRYAKSKCTQLQRRIHLASDRSHRCQVKQLCNVPCAPFVCPCNR